ncbi:MAG: hypothetical protein WBL27_10080 [Salinimicrobium sp.]
MAATVQESETTVRETEGGNSKFQIPSSKFQIRSSKFQKTKIQNPGFRFHVPGFKAKFPGLELTKGRLKACSMKARSGAPGKDQVLFSSLLQLIWLPTLSTRIGDFIQALQACVG